jgi:2-succinyl-5-enolpyruvyl-6-hydroxy-3-cyclohexene-1-carboxylate synthase
VGDGDAPARPFAAVVAGRRTLDDGALEELAARLASAQRGLIIAGPDDDPALPAALALLARATGFPIIADPLSGLRTGPHDRSMVVTRGDQLVRPGRWIEAHSPDLVLRTGAMPTSKPLVGLLERTRPELIVFDGDAGWREAALVPATFVHADATTTAQTLAARLTGSTRSRPANPAWTVDWLEAERAATEAMADWLMALDEPFEGAPWPLLAAALPDGAVLWAASSMPVRDMDAWLPSTDRAIAVRSSRGANGIDGVVSTALGSAAVADGPVALVVGDITFLHDLNALVAARLHGLSATIVLVNNDGGGIFSFLPQAQPAAAVPGSGLPDHYEELFGTPHGIDVGPAVTALGGEHRFVAHADIGAAIRDSVGRPGLRVLELRTDRARNLHLHREVAAVVQRAIAGAAG